MKKSKSRASVPLPFVPSSPATHDTSDPRLLVNKLTVGDARRLLLHEGAAKSVLLTIVDLGFILVTAALVANAIWKWNAGLWHMLFPLLAQYFALITFIPILQLFYRLPDFRSNVIKSFGNIAGWILVASVIIASRAYSSHTPWTTQLGADLLVARDWIVNHQMHWPIVTAYIGFAMTLPAQFRTCRDFGPPFVSVSFGCAFRILILFLFFFLSWIFVVASPQASLLTGQSGAWIIWGLLLVADLLAWSSLLDIRRRLKRIDAQTNK